MKIHIREAEIGDAEAMSVIADQVHAMHRKARPDIYRSCKRDIFLGFIKETLVKENMKTLIAEDHDKTLLGYTVIKVIDINEDMNPILKPRVMVYMNQLGVEESFRGQGIGRKLTEEVIAVAEELNADSLELGVWSFNKGAYDFYKGLGLKERTIRMELKL